MSFVKLDTKVLDSTLWFDKPARDVFLTALLMAIPREFETSLQQIQVDKIEPTGFVAPPGWYGYVTASGPGLVHRAIVDPNEGIEALRRLGNPDDATGSQAFEGRRMIRIDGGYAILNYMRYREFDHSAAERMRRLRERRKALRRNNRNVRANVTHSREQIADAEIDSKTSSSELKGSSDQECRPARKNPTQPSKEACRLAQLLKAEILRNKPDYRITSAQERKWALSADRMIRLDHREPNRIAKLISWAQRDDFWMPNILSMEKLREKFDVLEIKARGLKKAPPPLVNAADEARRQLAEERVRERAHAPSVQVERYNNNLAAMLRGRVATPVPGSGVEDSSSGTSLVKPELSRGVAAD